MLETVWHRCTTSPSPLPTGPNPLYKGEVRPDVGTALAACCAHKLAFYVGEPDIIGPLIGADPCRMAALEIRTEHDDAPNARATQFTKSDLSWSLRWCNGITHMSSRTPLKNGCRTLPSADFVRYSISAFNSDSTQMPLCAIRVV